MQWEAHFVNGKAPELSQRQFLVGTLRRSSEGYLSKGFDQNPSHRTPMVWRHATPLRGVGRVCHSSHSSSVVSVVHLAGSRLSHQVCSTLSWAALTGSSLSHEVLHSNSLISDWKLRLSLVNFGAFPWFIFLISDPGLCSTLPIGSKGRLYIYLN